MLKDFLKIIAKHNFAEKELNVIEKWIIKEFEGCNVETCLKIYIPRYKKKCEVPNIIINKKGISITIWADTVESEYLKKLIKEDKYKIIMEIINRLRLIVD